VQIGFSMKDNADATNELGYLQYKRDGADNQAKFSIFVRQGAGASAERLVIDSTGKIGMGNAGAAPNSVRGVYSVYNHTVLSGSSQLGAEFVGTGFRTGSSQSSSVTGLSGNGAVHASNNQNWTGQVSLVGVSAHLSTQTNSTGVITGAASFKTGNPDEYGATFTNYYGMFINQITAATNDYAIYTAGSTQSYFGGNVTVAGTFTNSDSRLKTNVQTLSSALSKVVQMRGVSYDTLETGESRIGVIAQEMESVVPEVVMTGANTHTIHTDTEDEIEFEGIKSVAYDNLVAYLIEAIKELKVEVDALKA